MAKVTAYLGLALSLIAMAMFFCEAAHADPAGAPDHVFRFNPSAGVSRSADSDGVVPEYIVCGFRALGRYSWHETPSGEVEGVIRYNICAHRRLEHRVREWRATIEHERKHALGYSLGERPRR